MRHIDFYFDPISPYSWLAWTQLPELTERTGARVRFIPVLFAGLLNAHGTKGPAETPAKRAYTMKDAMRWAMKYGKPFEGPPAHPFNPLKALRMCVAIEDDHDRELFAGNVLDAVWARGLDVTKDSILGDLARRAGLDGERILARASTPEVKERLRRHTDEAIARGVFGVPTFIVDGELFWGNDRVPLVIDYLEGRLSLDRDKIARVLDRPRAADRLNV